MFVLVVWRTAQGGVFGGNVCVCWLGVWAWLCECVCVCICDTHLPPVETWSLPLPDWWLLFAGFLNSAQTPGRPAEKVRGNTEFTQLWAYEASLAQTCFYSCQHCLCTAGLILGLVPIKATKNIVVQLKQITKSSFIIIHWLTMGRMLLV